MSGKPISKIWNPEYYSVELLPTGKRKATCNFCGAKSYTENASKMKDHILQCPQADEETKLQFQPTKRLRESKPFLTSQYMFGPSSEVNAHVDEDKSQRDVLPLRQAPRIQGVADQIGQNEQNTVTGAFARWIYSASLPLSVTENPYFCEFAEKVCPAWKYPSRFQLSSNLLESEVAHVDAVNASAVVTASTIVVQSNGWTSVKGKALINFMAVCDCTPIYLGTIDSKAEAHTSSYIAELIKSKINEIGTDKVFALCTDNAVNMRLAWHLLRDDFPSLVCFGCAARSFSLYAKDIVKIPEIKEVVSNATAVLKWLKLKQLPNTVLNEKCIEIFQQVMTVHISIESRWGTVFYSLTRLQQLRMPIEQTVMDPRLQSGTDEVPDHIRQFVLSYAFWNDIEAVTHILRPLVKAILLTESDLPQPGLICHIIQQMKSFTEDSDDCRHFGCKVHQKLLDICQACADVCLSDIHFAANILDPRFRGEQLTEDQDIKGTQFIAKAASESDFAAMSPDFEMQVFEQLGEFKTMTGTFSNKFKWNPAKTMHPMSWWSSFHSKNPLSETARKILNVTPTAGPAITYNWKRRASTQMKLCSEFGVDRIQKLVHVSSLLALQKKQKQGLTSFIADLSRHNFNVIHGPDNHSVEGTHMDEADSRMLMDLMESGQFDVDELETDGVEDNADYSCDV